MAARTAYDEVRYSNYPYAQTHPDRLATVAELHGLAAPDPGSARVLELGCGAGGNLLAMAAATPGIEALGIDLASEPIDEGRRAVAEVGLRNVELRQGDLLDLTDGRLGDFDYVISHGVYAWVPEPARDALLAACRSHLAADGIAYVSYNANPGGHMRSALREAGLWFARAQHDPVAKAERAQVLFRFLAENRAGTDDWWGGLLAGQLPAYAHGPTYRLVHDDLADHWSPVWFAEFAERAARHGLAYVGDGDLANLLTRRIPGAVDDDLRELAAGDRVAYEQIADLLRCVFFRQSVLCRDSRKPAAEPDAGAVRRLHFAARAGAEGSDDGQAGLLASAMALLRARAPDTIGFDELRAALGADPDALADAMLEGFHAELVMPHRAPLRAVSPAGVERPAASPLARWQARRELEVTSLAYTSVRMEEPAARLLITLLDGTRDRAAIRAEFAERTGVRLSAADLDANLEQLGRLFLLSGS
ncbi:MAG: methyltransferase regulatory domain-containing protein [Solirubrobacteraceae bacterium]